MENIRYAVFDMDGTLADSMRYWIGVLDEYLDAISDKVCLPADVHEKMQHMNLAQGAEYLRSLEGFPKELLPRADATVTLMRTHYEKDILLRDGARELLEKLKAQNVRMGIATLTPRTLVDVCLKKNGIYDCFEFFFTSDEYPKGKSDDLIFLDISRHFGVPCEEIWLFEDCLYSVERAKALGYRIAVTEEEEQKTDFEALYEISDMYFKNGFLNRVK